MRMIDLVRWALPVAFLRLNFGDGGDSSTSSDTSTTTNTTATDRRTVADNGAVVVGDGSTANIQLTDLDSVKAAAEVAQAAVLGATKLATESNANAGKVITELKDAYQMANEQAAGTRSLVGLGLALVAVVALQTYSRGKR